MSVDYYLYTVVGVPLNKKELIIESTRDYESCEHPERSGHKFCPECGVEVREKITEESEIFIDGFELYKADDSNDFGVYGVALKLITPSCSHPESYFSVTSGAILKPTGDLEETFAFVQEKLKEAGISLTGLDIYTVVNVSY